jgi:predicted metallo-beta-lactamase superfamily hydrolase
LGLSIAVRFSEVGLLATGPQAPVVVDHTMVRDIEYKLFQNSSRKERDINVKLKSPLTIKPSVPQSATGGSR